MANEITVQGLLRYAKNSARAGLSFGPATFTLTGNAEQRGVQTVGTSEEPLNLGDVTTGGWCIIRNLDATNFVSFKAAAGAVPLIKIPPNAAVGPLVVHPSATAPYVQADTAPCRIEYLILPA